jgi:hypothetical protein
MPRTRRSKPIYQRGEFRLYPREGRNLEIVWYDEQRKRERCISAGTTDERTARIATDNEYVKKHGGIPRCPCCGQQIEQSGEYAAVLIANYKGTKPKGDAVHPRLDHILLFVDETGRTEDRVNQVTEEWASAFRQWMSARDDRERAPGTIENSLIQLAAAFRHGGVKPSFETIPTKDLNRTPQHRSDVVEIAAMFRYCLEPKNARTPKETERRRKERENLLRFLRASVATWARPDAVLEISTAKDRGQWHSKPAVLALNPVGRRQTRKRRATVPIARQFAPHLNEVDGPYIPVETVKSAWESMASELGLPDRGEAGMKLIRRSMMTLGRRRLGEEHWVQGRMFAGHVPVNVSDLYALLDPANLGRALAITEAIIDEIEAVAPGAFYRDFTAQGGNVASIGRGLKA